MAITTDKGRPVAATVVTIPFNPTWDVENAKFTSPIPKIQVNTAEVVDPTDTELKYIAGYRDLQLERQIAEGLMTIEEIAQAMATFRKAFYNEALLPVPQCDELI